MQFSVSQFINPLNREEKKYYAVPTWNEEVTIRTLAEEISKMSTLTTIDIVAVIEALLVKLPGYLKAGNTVRLGDFGTLKLSFNSIGKDTEEDVTANDIFRSKVLFRAGNLLKTALRDVKYSKK